MVKIVDMTSALKQVREGKLNEISPDMRKFELEKQYKMILKDMPASERNTEAGKIRAMDLARVTATRAPGMTMKDLKILQKNKGTLKLEDLDKDDEKTIKPIIKQLKKSVAAHDAQAKQLKKDISDEKDLEEQAKELEEQLKTAEKELEELYIKEDKAYVIRFKRIKDKERMVVVFRNQNDADMYADNIKKQGGQVFSNKLEKVPLGIKLKNDLKKAVGNTGVAYKVVDKK